MFNTDADPDPEHTIRVAEHIVTNSSDTHTVATIASEMGLNVEAVEAVIKHLLELNRVEPVDDAYRVPGDRVAELKDDLVTARQYRAATLPNTPDARDEH